MSSWKKKCGMALATGAMAAIAFSLPIIPGSDAKPSAIKVMSDEARANLKEHFQKGKSQNLKLETVGNQTILAPASASEATYTSPVIKSDIIFTDVAVYWKNHTTDPAKAEQYFSVDVRYSADGEKWSNWTEAHIDPEIYGPEMNKEHHVYSQLVYAKKSQFFQYRISMKEEGKVVPKIKDIKVAFFNSEDGQKSIPKQSLWDKLVSAVSAEETKPDVISRSSWGADESIRFVNGVESWPREYHSVSHLFVHHTGAISDADPANTPARIRSIYSYHTLTKKWGDIGYNALIGADGKIYEGRKGKDGEALTNNVVGAGTYGFNKGGYSISMLGNYNGTSLPANMRESLVSLLAYQAKVHNIDPTGVSDFVRDYEVTDPKIPKVDYNVANISGHRDSKYTAGTECPGDMIYNDLPNLRKDVAELLQAQSSLKRLAGLSRYGTSAAISKEVSTVVQSDTIVIARGDLFPDALAAAPLAAKGKAPIILTDPTTLKPETQAEIQRLKPTKAIIMGSTGAVSTTVEEQLKSLGVTNVTRVAGTDRFDGAAITAEKVVSDTTTPVDSAFIALGTNFPDALSVTSVAGQKGWPILLVKTDSIPAQIQTFIQNHPEIKNFYIIGGSAVVSDGVKASLEATGATTVRISGIDRFATAVEVTKYFNLDATSIVFASGLGFPDALSGGPLAAYTKSPILLTNTSTLPASVNTYLTSKEGTFQKGYILGGEGVVSVSVKNDIASHIK